MSHPLKPTALIATAMILLVSCSAPTEKEAAKDTATKSAAERGEYLVSTIGCDDCHSPKRMGAKGPELVPELRLSGYPSDRPIMAPDTAALKKGWSLFSPDLTQAIGPWGTTFAANITSDSTGIGGWTEEQFIKAMREGKSKGLDNSRPILPPMPWQNFAKLSDEDLKAMFAYLLTTKAVKNIVPAPKAM